MIYRSNLRCPDLTPFFPRLISDPLPHTLGHDALREQFTAEELGGETLAKDFSLNGFLTHDEAAILYHIVSRTPGWWLDIGGAMGWSAAHMHAAGATAVDSIDSMYGNAGFLARRLTNYQIEDCHINLIGDRSSVYLRLPEWAYAGVLIDGSHGRPYPLTDTVQALAHQAEIFVYHDFLGDTPAEAAWWLINEFEFGCRIYDTPHLMAVCWDRSSDFEPPDHIPDPAVDWSAHRAKLAEDYPWTANL